MTKSHYTDLEDYYRAKRKYDREYYGATAVYPASEYTQDDDELILAHRMPDRELSRLIGHSMMAIQIRRCRLKKNLEKEASL